MATSSPHSYAQCPRTTLESGYRGYELRDLVSVFSRHQLSARRLPEESRTLHGVALHASMQHIYFVFTRPLSATELDSAVSVLLAAWLALSRTSIGAFSMALRLLQHGDEASVSVAGHTRKTAADKQLVVWLGPWRLLACQVAGAASVMPANAVAKRTHSRLTTGTGLKREAGSIRTLQLVDAFARQSCLICHSKMGLVARSFVRQRSRFPGLEISSPISSPRTRAYLASSSERSGCIP